MIAAISVLVLLAVVYVDERKLGAIQPGMALAEVESALGTPSRVAERCEIYLPLECAPKELLRCFIYDRSLRSDLIVGFDREQRVKCVHRARTFKVTL
jgi:hypothetical protein